MFVRAFGDDVLIETFVQPRAPRSSVAGIQGGALKLKVTAPPVDDRANRAVEGLLAEVIGVPRSRVTVQTGRSSRHKRVMVEGASATSVAEALLRRIR